MKLWLNVAEGAEYAGVCKDLTYDAFAAGQIRHIRIGGRRAIRMKRESIDAWFERQAVEAPAEAPQATPPTPASPPEARRRLAFAQGEHHLWIYMCNWRVRIGDEVIADNESADARMEAAARAFGVPAHVEAVAAALAGRPLARVVVTHGHHDHDGMGPGGFPGGSPDGTSGTSAPSA